MGVKFDVCKYVVVYKINGKEYKETFWATEKDKEEKAKEEVPEGVKIVMIYEVMD